MLDAKGARDNADDLARTLYALLVAYIMEAINSRTCAVEESVANTISIVDFPGFAVRSTAGKTLDQLLNNAAAESLYNVCLNNFFDRQAEILDAEEVAVPATSYFDNSDAVRGLMKPGNGLLGILDDQSRRGKSDQQFLESIRKRFEGKNPAISVSSATTVLPGSNFATPNAAASFSVKHYAGEVDYPIEGLMEANAEIISGDMMNLFRSTKSEFVAKLFKQEAINAVHHPKEKATIMQASVASKPMRMPSMARKKFDRMARIGRSARATAQEDDNSSEAESRADTNGGRNPKAEPSAPQGVASQFMSSLSNITKSLSAPNTNSYFVICLRPNERRIANQFDTKCVRLQLQTFGIAEISQRLRNADFSVFIPFGEFLGLAETESVFVGTERERANTVVDEKSWPGNEAQVGATGVFLSERCWFEVANVKSAGPPGGSRFLGGDVEDGSEGQVTPNYGDSKLRLIPGSSPFNDDKNGYFGAKDVDARSDAGVSAYNGNMFGNMDTREQMVEKTNEKQTEVVEEVRISGSRKRWMVFVWFLTFWIPPFAVRWIVKTRRKDVIDAWREKLAINMLIWLSCGIVIFFMGKSRTLVFKEGSNVCSWLSGINLPKARRLLSRRAECLRRQRQPSVLCCHSWRCV
jgi:chitin synthase